MTAAEIMDRAAALLNDTAKTVFTYSAQLPYLNIAVDDLQEILEENNIPVTNDVASLITIAVGVTEVPFGSIAPILPSDLVEIQKISERLSGSNDSFIPMRRVEFLPPVTVVGSELSIWSWQEQIVKFLGATTARQIKIEYIAAKLTAVTTSTQSIVVINSKSFLAYRTAALCAYFIGENPERATVLDGKAEIAREKMLTISNKGKQAIITRRRPFMASYRLRGFN